jgi:tetratricopeptide (TPR) repeat protein
VVRLQGRDVLLRLRDELARALNLSEASSDETKMTAFMYGRCLANLGQTYTDIGRFEDSLEDLEEALRYHDAAMEVEERMREVGSRYHSLRMRSSTRKLVAHLLDDTEGDRVSALMDGALADVEAAVALARQHPELRSFDGAGILRNLANTKLAWTRHRLRQGDVSDHEARRVLDEVEALVEEVRRSSDVAVLVGLAETEMGLRELRDGLQGLGTETTEEDLARLLTSALATRQLPGGHGIEAHAARSAVSALLHWSKDDSRLLPVELWPLLASVLAWLEPEEVGLDVLAHAIAAEVTLLSRESGHPRDGWDPVGYFHEALREFDRRLRDPRSTDAERQLYAGWMRRLVEVRFAWTVAVDGRPVATDEEVELLDRSGSAAWRSDLEFFGAGGVLEGDPSSEAHWRCNLYRTRWVRDAAAEVLKIDAMSQFIPMAMPGAAEYLERLATSQITCDVVPHDTPIEELRRRSPTGEWYPSPDGIVIPMRWTPAKAREELRALERELLIRLQFGQERGWKPATGNTPPVADAGQLRNWLEEHPDVALLIVGEGPARVCRAAEGRLVLNRVAVPDTHPVSEAIQAYLEARDDHSFGTEEDIAKVVGNPSDLHPSELDEPAMQAAIRAVIATPAAAEALGAKLEHLLSELGQVLGPALEEALHAGARHLIVVPRNWARHVPWLGVRLGESTLFERFGVSIIETLANVERAPVRNGPTSLYLGGVAGPGSALHLGRICLASTADEVTGPLNRDAFEALARRSRVLRVMAHGQALLMFQQSSGIILDESNPEAHNRYAASEMRAMELRGARRVELWACESGRDDELFRHLFHHDEPGGLDGALLLAGCEVVLSSLWVQYALSAAMIGEAFALRTADAAEAPESEALSWAISQYREAVAPGGVFAAAVETRFAAGRCSSEEALATGLTAWRASLGIDSGGPVQVGAEMLAQLGHAVNVRTTPHARAEDLLGPLRSPVAWAGWKITLRSKETLWPRAD